MATSLSPRSGRALAEFAKGLERGADSFTPGDVDSAPERLPGRRRGENLATGAAPAMGPAAVILDCGTSRRGDFSHVLWISPSVEVLLGSDAAERLGGALTSIAGVTASRWEGAEHLHLRAPSMSHEELLDAARAVVAQLSR